MFGVDANKFKKKDPRDWLDARDHYGLSRKQWLFAMEYVGAAECIGWKAAARTYGDANGTTEEGGSMKPEVAKSIAIQNLKKPNIVACIQDLMGITSMSPNEVLHRITRLAKANLSDLMDVDPETGKPVLNLKKAQERGAMYLVKKMNFDAFGNLKSLEIHDSFLALTKMGQHHKLFDRQREQPIDPRDLARELLEDLRAKHEDMSDQVLVEKVLARFSGSGVTQSDLLESPEANELHG
jgi:hypothetical protein